MYLLEIAAPSERKSAILSDMTKPLGSFENEYNRQHSAEVEMSRMQKRMLARRQKAIEEQAAKNKATDDDVNRIAQQLAEYREVKPLRLFADDITPEKLISVLARNNERIALLSSEAGIFDTLAGAYAKSVNIDVMLKSYSGDEIRVDRIGRESEYIRHPALTILLMAQPEVISKVLKNETFRGRGLTARFLYSMPESVVGERKFWTLSVPQEISRAYEQCFLNMLEDEYSDKPEIITLSSEAGKLLGDFAEDLEPKLIGEYAEMADWCGKLVGNILRISGLLCRADVFREDDFTEEGDRLEADENVMKRAIEFGRYFLNHAKAVYTTMPGSSEYDMALRILKMIKDRKLTEFDRRTAMRNCRCFRTADEIQPVLDMLEDYGYIAALPQRYMGTGRPPQPKYAVNPLI